MNSSFNKINNFFGPSFVTLVVLSIALWMLTSVFSLPFLGGHLNIIEASTTDNVSGYAWSSNIGWISFNCTNENDCADNGGFDYGVNLDLGGTDELSGYAWSSNIGWISFNTADVAGCPSGTCQPRINTSTNELEGWAKALAGNDFVDGWDGWISLSGVVTAGSYWKVAYNSPAIDIEALTIDTTNNVIYAGGGSNGTIYRCVLSTGCDSDSEWSIAYNTGQGSVLSLTFDPTPGKSAIFAGTESSSRIYRCYTSTGCTSSVNWIESTDNPKNGVRALVFDPFRRIVFAGDGQGDVYGCRPIADDCDENSDWDKASVGDDWVDSLVADSAKGVIYAGTGSQSAIHYCDTSGGNCSGGNDWYPAFDAPGGGNILALTIANGVIYAGGEGTNLIYRCDTNSAGMGCRDQGNWGYSFAPPQERVRSLTSANGYVYAGIDSMQSDVNGHIYRCATSTGCNQDSHWKQFYVPTASNPLEDRIPALLIDLANDVLYAGTGFNGIIYRCVLSTGCGDEPSVDTYGVTLSDTGAEVEGFSGFAWGGEVVGWVDWDPQFGGEDHGVEWDGGPPNVPPTADAGPDKTQSISNLNFTFNCIGTDTDGTIDSYEWDFGDGSPPVGGSSPNHTYADPGSYPTTYTATCTVTDDRGGTGSDTRDITIIEFDPPNIVSFIADPPIVRKGESSTLSWDARNVAECTLSGDTISDQTFTATPPAMINWVGSISTGAINSESDYDLSCTGLNYGIPKDAQVKIRIAPTFREL